MAIYHMSVKAISRSKGRSSTAAAAYRAGCKIEDKRTGIKHDYTKKQGVDYTEIIVPDGVNIPDRADLWNAVEAAEKRKDSCTAREYEIALPHELDDLHRCSLARDFCRQLAKIHGIAVDLCIHKPNDREIAAGADPRNHHAHILTTTRKITNDGLGDKADIEQAGRKRKEDLKLTRELWAETANKYLEYVGSKERIDSRSLKDQGSALMPTIKMGKIATQMERDPLYTPKGKEPRPRYNTFKGDVNRSIAATNELIKNHLEDYRLDAEIEAEKILAKWTGEGKKRTQNVLAKEVGTRTAFKLLNIRLSIKVKDGSNSVVKNLSTDSAVLGSVLYKALEYKKNNPNSFIEMNMTEDKLLENNKTVQNIREFIITKIVESESADDNNMMKDILIDYGKLGIKPFIEKYSISYDPDDLAALHDRSITNIIEPKKQIEVIIEPKIEKDNSYDLDM